MSQACQSCSMPLRRDPRGGGSNADGSKNGEYCSHCYVDGAFAQPDCNAAEMRALCIESLVEGGVPKLIARIMTKGIPRLKRWAAK